MKIKEVNNALDSDDEFPDEYNEPIAVPDYLNECRFDAIQFKWIDKFTRSSNINASKEELKPNKNLKTRIIHNGLIINKGVMSKQDLYCLKTIATSCPNNVLIWFTNFTIYKDLQSPYNFIRNCLVTR